MVRWALMLSLIAPMTLAYPQAPARTFCALPRKKFARMQASEGMEDAIEQLCGKAGR
jgi:hypothetical protein